jgi:hypothetical protein
MADDSDGILPEPLRTVTPPYAGRPDSEMNLVGWAMFAILLVLLIPLGPFILLAWLLSRLSGRWLTGEDETGAD